MCSIKKITSYLLSVMILLATISGKSWGQASDEVLKEAKILAKIENVYFKKRLNNDLEGVYQYQHPVYKEKISLEEFQYFEGRVVSDYREGMEAHISGGMLPPIDFIKKNPTKRDPLGFPRPSYYQWYSNPFITVKSYSLERISISKDGKYAKAEITIQGEEQLNPAAVRANIRFDIERPHVDYWEKVDGQWAITVLVKNDSISGARTVYRFVPNNNDAWQKMDYIEIDSESLLAEPDPERHALQN